MYLASASCRNTSRVIAAAQLDDPLLRHQRLQAHLLEVEADQLLFFLGRQVGDVDDDREAIGGGFRERKRALSELDRVHRGDREAEGRQLVGGFADRDGAVLQALEKRALRLQRDAVDLVEQDDFRRRERAELGDELAGRRVDHLESDHFGRLQVGAALEPRELRAADRGEDDAEEGLADARHAAQEQISGVHLTLVVLVVGGRNFGQQHDVGEGFLGFVADQRVAGLGNDRFVQVDGFL